MDTAWSSQAATSHRPHCTMAVGVGPAPVRSVLVDEVNERLSRQSGVGATAKPGAAAASPPAQQVRGAGGVAQVVAAARRTWRSRLPNLAQVLHQVRRCDLAVVYALVVLGLTIAVNLRPAPLRAQFVEQSSTNLANLRRQPLHVLVVSAFVIPAWRGLTILAPLVLAFGAAQRWVGRLATVVVAVIGHVGATLFVAILLTAGLTRGRLARSVIHAPDVGVSYGLACVAAFLTARLPARWRWPYLGLLAAYFCLPLLLHPTFTAVGHTTALLLGLGLALLAARAAAAGPQPAGAGRRRSREQPP